MAAKDSRIALDQCAGRPGLPLVATAIDEDIPGVGLERCPGEPGAIAENDYLVLDRAAPAAIARHQLARLAPGLSFVGRFDDPGLPGGNGSADFEEQIDAAVGRRVQYWIPMRVVADLGQEPRRRPLATAALGAPDADIVVALF